MWQTYRNRNDPDERIEARLRPEGGYECRRPEGVDIGAYPADVFEELYIVEEGE